MLLGLCSIYSTYVFCPHIKVFRINSIFIKESDSKKTGIQFSVGPRDKVWYSNTEFLKRIRFFFLIFFFTQNLIMHRIYPHLNSSFGKTSSASQSILNKLKIEDHKKVNVYSWMNFFNFTIPKLKFWNRNHKCFELYEKI